MFLLVTQISRKNTVYGISKIYLIIRIDLTMYHGKL